MACIIGQILSDFLFVSNARFINAYRRRILPMPISRSYCTMRPLNLNNQTAKKEREIMFTEKKRETGNCTQMNNCRTLDLILLPLKVCCLHVKCNSNPLKHYPHVFFLVPFGYIDVSESNRVLCAMELVNNEEKKSSKADLVSAFEMMTRENISGNSSSSSSSCNKAKIIYIPLNGRIN